MTETQGIRLRELALEIATANGVLRANMALGRPTANLEVDYQRAVLAFDALLEAIRVGLSDLPDNHEVN